MAFHVGKSLRPTPAGKVEDRARLAGKTEDQKQEVKLVRPSVSRYSYMDM